MPLPVMPHRSSWSGEVDEPMANRHTVARYARQGDASDISARAKFARARLHRCRCDPALAPHVTDTPGEPSDRPVRPPPMERAASVGLDNPPGGPGKGPETPDKPTPPRTDAKPSADASSTSGTPRIDSYVAAGQPVPGRPEASTEQRGDRGTPPNGSSTDSSSADPAGEKPRTPGDPPPEADPKSEKEPESGKTEVGSQRGKGATTTTPTPPRPATAVRKRRSPDSPRPRTLGRTRASGATTTAGPRPISPSLVRQKGKTAARTTAVPPTTRRPPSSRAPARPRHLSSHPGPAGQASPLPERGSWKARKNCEPYSRTPRPPTALEKEPPAKVVTAELRRRVRTRGRTDADPKHSPRAPTHRLALPAMATLPTVATRPVAATRPAVATSQRL